MLPVGLFFAVNLLILLFHVLAITLCFYVAVLLHSRTGDLCLGLILDLCGPAFTGGDATDLRIVPKAVPYLAQSLYT